MCGTENGIASPAEKRTLSSANGRMPSLPSDSVLQLSTGDPTMFEPFWQKMGDKCKMVIGGSELMSYYSNLQGVCWFLEPELEDAIRRLHRMVGNAESDNRYVVVGTGSTMVFQAVLYALTSPGGPEPVSIVSSAPYYSAYMEVVDLLRSGLYKWEGDAYTYNKEGPYIEVVNSPNNPDGTLREAVVNRTDGKLIHDLAYYWPQYAPITHKADYDIMLFTFSKCTGHAGSRIGWALVKDKEIAIKMTEFITISSIGVSKEAQVRAAKIIGAICDGYENGGSDKSEKFFEYGRNLMSKRWQKLREVVEESERFTLPKYPKYRCLYTGELTELLPAFAWLKCKESIKDCEEFLRGFKLIARGGKRFGCDMKYARVSLMSREEEFNQLITRLLAMKGISNGH